MDKAELKKMLEEIENEKGNEQEAKKVESVSDIVEKLGDKIKDAIKESRKASENDAQDFTKEFFSEKRGLAGIVYPEMNQLSSLSKDEKIVVWFKALMNKDRDIQANQVFKALVEGTDAEGGYLVPEEFRSEVFRILPDFAVMRNIARILPMNTDTLNLNTLVAKPYAYWTGEYASKSTTSAEFGRVTLNPADLVCLLPVTHQLIADANINIIQFITELFAEAIGQAEDKAFFSGSGTGQPKGINQETLGYTQAVAKAMTFDHVIGMYQSLPQRIRNSPRFAWVGSSRVLRLLRTLKDGSNRYIWEQSVQIGQPDRILGKPIYEQNDIADTELYGGDWSYYVIGDRQQIVVETTREGGDAWRRNATEIKAVERVDGACVLTGAFGKLTGI